MTVRTDTEILTVLLADGQSQGITAADERDAFETVRAGRVWINAAWTPAAIVTALQAGGHVHFAANAGVYDLTSIANSTVLSNSLKITGDGRDRVTIRVAATSGSPPGIGTDLFLFRGSTLHVDGVKFIGDRVAFALTGLTTRVEDIEIFDCGWQDTGTVLKFDTTTAPSGAQLGFVKVHRNHGRNLNCGVDLRLGDGSASANYDVTIDKFEAFDNDFEVIDKYGIVCNYDDIDSSYVYGSPESHAIASRNRIVDLQGRTASTVTGFGINLSACRHVKISDNHLEDIIKGTNPGRVNIEAIYNKSFDACIDGNTVANCDGDQGAIACKGGSAGHNVLVTNNLIIATDIAMLNGIWVQAPNCSIDGNTLRGTFTTSAIKTGGGEAVDGLRITNNDILCGVNAGSHGIRVDTPCVGLEIKGNRIRRVADGAGTWRAILVTMGAGQAVPDPVIEGNTIVKIGAGVESVIGIELAPNATGAITAPQILRNKFLNVTTGISLITVACTGIVRLMTNTSVGTVTADVSNPANSTIDSRLNSWSEGALAAPLTLTREHMNTTLRVTGTGTTTVPAGSTLGSGFACTIVSQAGSGFTRTIDGPGANSVDVAPGETATISVMDNNAIVVSKGPHTVIS